MTRKRLKMLKRKKNVKEVRMTQKKILRSQERHVEVRELAAQSMWLFQELAKMMPQTLPDIGCLTDVNSDGEVAIEVGDFHRHTTIDLKAPLDPEVIHGIMADIYIRMCMEFRFHLDAEYVCRSLVPNIEKILKNVDIVGEAPYIRVVGLPGGLGVQHGPQTWAMSEEAPTMICKQIIARTRQIARLYHGCTITFDKDVRQAKVYNVAL